jgi:hypothetical protein
VKPSHIRRGPLARLALSGLVLLSTLLGPGLHTHEMGSEAYVRLLLHSSVEHAQPWSPRQATDSDGAAAEPREDASLSDCESTECSEHRISGDHSHCPICFLQMAGPAAETSVARRILELDAEPVFPPDSPCINRRIHVRFGRAPPQV